MAEELEIQVKQMAENVQSVVEKAAKIDSVQGEVTTVKTELESTKAELKSISDALVKKDESDKKNQEALDKLIAKSQNVPLETEKKSFNQVLEEKLLEHQDDIMKMATKDKGRKTEFSIHLDTKAVGDVSIANYTGGTRGLTQLRSGLITNPARKVHVRDLVPTGNAGPGTEFVYMKENGDGEGSIATVAEGSTKSQFDVDLIEASVKFETIAGWMRVTRKAMNNIQGFTSYLQARLPEKLLRVEDAQLLNGDGVSPNIKGITAAGNHTAASGAATVDIEQLVQAISQLEELDREATGIVLRPSDYYALLLNKAAGSGEYDLPNIVTVSPEGMMRILGIPTVASTAMTVDKFIVGDFRMGAQLLIQEGIRIEFFEQDGDNVRTNKITVRIEETVAFPVFGSDYFIYGDFGNVA